MNGRHDELRTPLKRARHWGSAKDGVHHFIWQRASAIAIGLSGLWLFAVALSMHGTDFASVHARVADPINASMLVLFLLSVFWHARLGLQVVIEDYVHGALSATLLQFLTLLVCALAAIASVLAVLRIVLGS